jgi:hypothetical protein
MTEDNEDKQSQLDLGLTQILESLSNPEPSDAKSVEDDSQLDSVPVTDQIDPRVTSISDSIQNQSLPVVLVVPQLLDVLRDRNSFNQVSKDKLIECAVKITKDLLRQDESLLADSVLTSIEPSDLPNSCKQSLLEALDQFIVSSKNVKQEGFTSEDPKLLNARLSLLEFYRSIKPKIDDIKNIYIPPSTIEKFEFSSTADRKFDKKDRKKINPWISYALIISVLIAIYSLFLNYNYIPYDMADSDYAKNYNSSSLGSLVKDESSLQRQEVSNLSALMYDVSRQPTALAAPSAVASPTSPVIENAQPSTSTAAKRKISLDMTGPIEPERVKQLMDNRDSSIYERPMNRIDRLPVLSDDYLPSERDSLPNKDRDSRRQIDRPGRFNSGQRYEVMINTSVMDAPSFNAKEVEELYVGDRVRVEARLGRWLKIRSRDGNPGYILAGDAEKLFD